MQMFLYLMACQSDMKDSGFNGFQDGESVEVPEGQGHFVGQSNPEITTFALLSEIQTGELVISEVMHTPQQTAYDSYGEWIELYNAGDVSIDLNGLELTSNNDSGLIFSNSLIVEPGDYVVLATRSGQNGGIEYDGLYSSASIRHGINDDVSIGYNGGVLDSVSWNRDLDAITDGRSFSLDGDDIDAALNDFEYRWYAAQSTFGDGDYGTPGSANLPMYMGDELSAGDLVITEIMHNPTTVWDSRGEWFEVSNQTSGIIQLYGLDVGSTGESGFTVSTNKWMPSGELAVFGARAGVTVNGGVPVDVPYFFLDFILGQSDQITLSSNEGVVDTVSYNKFTWGQFNGVSISLSPVATDATDNDNARFWCSGDTVYGDGDFGTPGSLNASCANLDYDGDGLTLEDGDCDDENASATTSDAIEVCDGVDNDCDGLVDDADDSVEYTESDTWYLDIDGDGYGDDWVYGLISCAEPTGGNDVAFVHNADDCDDLDPTSTTVATDGDCDGIVTADDCDDMDEFSTIVLTDGDCDGVLTADDCDDTDASSTTISTDGDCDGVLTVEDCDDTDAASTTVSTDGDCDGIVTADDCDDSDSSTVNDMDCDGVLTAEDCDDTDASSTTVAIDGDCDGVLTADDCDDTDASSTTVSTDGDCDGAVTADDCDDSDNTVYPNAPEVSGDGIDQDCDGIDGLLCGLTDCDLNLDVGNGLSVDLVLIEEITDDLSNGTYIATTELTQGVFYELMGYNSYDGQDTYQEGDNYPAGYIDLTLAKQVANALTDKYNQQESLSLTYCYDQNGDPTFTDMTECPGFQIPTASDWTTAARAGIDSSFDGWTPANGGVFTAISDPCLDAVVLDGVTSPALATFAWYAANASGTSHEVAQLDANGWGLYDMHGNLGEVVSSGAARGGNYTDCMDSLTASASSSVQSLEDTNTVRVVMVDNHDAPSKPLVSLLDDVNGSENLVCQVDTESVDYQGNPVSYSFQWYYDDVLFTGSVATTNYTGDTILSAERLGGLWRCVVTPNNGLRDGESGQSNTALVYGSCLETECQLSSQSSVGFVLVDIPEMDHDLSSVNDFYIMETEITKSTYDFIRDSTLSSVQTPWSNPTKYTAAKFANDFTDYYNAANDTAYEHCYSNCNYSSCTQDDTLHCSGFRIPNPDEWSYAAYRNTNPSFTVPAQYMHCSANSLSDVGEYSPLYGLYDMFGNGWEIVNAGFGTSYGTWMGGAFDNHCNNIAYNREISGTAAGDGKAIGKKAVRLVRYDVDANAPYALDSGFEKDMYPSTLDLTCSIFTEATSVTGNPIAYTFEWFVNGVIYQGTTLDSVYQGDTIPSSELAVGDTWGCVVTPFDNQIQGFKDGDSVIILDCVYGECDYPMDVGTVLDFNQVVSSESVRPIQYLMTTEVTQEMFQTIMGYTPETANTYGVGSDYPTYEVSWHEAAAFANELTNLYNQENGTTIKTYYTCSGSGSSVSCTLRSPVYSGLTYGFRLPTEDEWKELAFENNTSLQSFWTVDGGGNVLYNTCDSTIQILDGVLDPYLSDYVNFCGNATTAEPVASLLPNSFGLYDMQGNVREWTHGGTLTGGAWNDTPFDLRVFYSTDNPGKTDVSIENGFRVGAMFSLE